MPKQARVTNLKESQHFDGSLHKPKAPGVYKRRIWPLSRDTYAYWDGKNWHAGNVFDNSNTSHTRAHRFCQKNQKSGYQHPHCWWGLAQEPKK